MSRSKPTWPLLLGTAISLIAASSAHAAEKSPGFARDIRPLLAAKCFACHGPDAEHREADLRLDDRQSAIESGAIAPGDADGSELIRRILSQDPDEQMPPPTSGESLTETQRQLLTEWVNAGAEYTPHWAFVPPRRPQIPTTQLDDRARNGIDHFISARLEAAELKLSPEADRYTLVRRLYLDLIGLPPTPEEADQFIEDDSPGAYEALVDRLLASEHYGERWAREWLDLARYADTNGYEKDRPRSIWPYRDWVIRALNDDMPFDQFTVEQLAGDMLPGATLDQRIATGFHRNTMLNEEGGIDPLEYRFYAMVDRVATTGTVWMGLTTGCAQCHSHKYDPITQTDYYSLMALMNNADEPDLNYPDPAVVRRRQELRERIAQLESKLIEQFPAPDGPEPLAERREQALQTAFEQWAAEQHERATNWTTLHPDRLSTNLPRLQVLPDGSIFSTGDITKRDVFQLEFLIEPEDLPVTALRLEVLPDERLPAGGPGRAYYEGRKGDFFLSDVAAELNDQPLGFASASHDYGKISIGSGKALPENVLDGEGSTGWSTSGREGQASQLVLNLAAPLQESGRLNITMVFERHFAASLGRFRFSTTSRSGQVKASDLPVTIEKLLARNPGSLEPAEQAELQKHFLRVTPALAEAHQEINTLEKQLPELPHTMILQERPADDARTTYRHHRGEYLSPREEVVPQLPSLFDDLVDSQPTNRLEFARWLVSEENPLVARVTVNRSWRALFGRGLVQTSGDFGTQSDPPSHPELLDWLAMELVERGWSLKQLHKLIVMSATYRQSSRVTPELLERDPANVLLARGPRFRVPAEMVRDAMLRSSGLLSEKMYGPSVYPPQPASVTALAYGNTRWATSKGEDRYRRSLYTFAKRTAPFAAFAVFDAPTGESCVPRRNRSNTPLQALTLLNDEMFLEMARSLARRTAQHSNDETERLTYVFRCVLTRPPTASEQQTLSSFIRQQRSRLESGELDAKQITADQSGSPDLATWVLVARAIMNLDEAVTLQ